MTATEASRRFAALLDEVERGETVVITRGGKQVASIAPASAGNGSALRALLAVPIDDGYAADVESVRELLTDDSAEWPAG